MHHIRYQTQNTALMNMNTLMAGLTALLLFCASCAHRADKADNNEDPRPEPVQVVTVDTTVRGLVIYYPPTDSIELRCFDRPDPKVDSSVVFCCAAAFTADWGSEPDHARICGDHVSRGVFYKRPRLKRNTGAFIVQENGWFFDHMPDADQEYFRTGFRAAVTAFRQEMMIHIGERVPTTRPDSNVNKFRALCQIGTKLCVVDSAEAMRFGDFIQLLLDAGMSEALYMDMGPGWNYSWYREYADSSATWIHSATLSSATNWLVFCHI